MRLAVIGVGSNSVRLLVADALSGQLAPVLRAREGTRLFASLAGGRLGDQGMRTTVDCVVRLAKQAREAGADPVLSFATSAVRDAENQRTFLEAVQRRAKLPMDVLSGEEEALLSYWGAASPGLCGIIDIGGGSTEWTVGRDGEVLAAVSQQLGAVRLAGRVPVEDADSLRKAVSIARALLEEGLPAMRSAGTPAAWVGVGGTFTTLAAMDLRLPAFDSDRVEGHPLTRATVAGWAERLAPMSLQERGRIPGLPAQRADIIAHGCAILLASMELLEIDALAVSDRGNLEGYVKRYLARLPAE